MRYFLEISYLGTHYHGWQKQQNAASVQEKLEEALAILLQTEISTIGSGRTDTGVHAKVQIVHFDTKKEIISHQAFLKKLNAILPNDISAKAIRRVNDDAHARYDANKRSYQYVICTKPEPFERGKAYYFYRHLDLEAMNLAASYLKGKHDFQSFSKVKANVNHYICEVWQIEWERKDPFLIFHVSANRFLHGMVRTLVGTLLDVGLGKIEPEKVKEILDLKDRRKAGRAAPPEGLFLTEVAYPENIYFQN
jgi:tRNA pseudouridine38-40 synthase